MIFRLITVVSVVAMILVLTAHRYRKTRGTSKKSQARIPGKGYLVWLFQRIWAFLKTAGIKGWRDRYQRWIALRYPARDRWIIVCLGISLSLLAASGFLFALLSPVRMYGSFLLLHITLGGVFAVCLTLATVFRARDYNLDGQNPEQARGASVPGRKSAVRTIQEKIFFWIFVVSGLSLIITALAQMLPYFTLNAQLDVFEVHRYSALVSLLSAIAFIYFSRIDDKK